MLWKYKIVQFLFTLTSITLNTQFPSLWVTPGPWPWMLLVPKENSRAATGYAWGFPSSSEGTLLPAMRVSSAEDAFRTSSKSSNHAASLGHTRHTAWRVRCCCSRFYLKLKQGECGTLDRRRRSVDGHILRAWKRLGFEHLRTGRHQTSTTRHYTTQRPHLASMWLQEAI